MARNIPDDSTPTAETPAVVPETRRARREAERRAQRRALPTSVVKTMRLGVLGGVVVAIGAFTVSQTSAQTGLRGPGDLADVGASALSFTDTAEAFSRAELDDRMPLEADPGPATFTLEVDGERHELETAAETLSEALAEAGVVLGPDDLVTAPVGGPVPEGQVVQIHRAADDLVTEQDVEECEVIEEEDPTLPEGEREVESEGRDGVTTSTYRVVSVGDEEVTRELVATVTTGCESQVVRVGTQTESAASGLGATADGEESPGDGGEGAPATGHVDPGSNRGIGQEMAAARGWGGGEWTCLDNLWQRESGWNHTAANPTSSAYGIPQSLPGSKMASHGSDWQTNPRTQIAWGLDYIAGRYGTPCGAWSHFQARNWY